MMKFQSLFMNKLKRSTPSDGSRRKQEMVASTAVDLGPTASLQSRTMMYARETAQPSNTRLVLTSERPLPRPPTSGKPMTASEQYWAARALTAEALLSMKSIHYEQIQMLSATEETKRAEQSYTYFLLDIKLLQAPPRLDPYTSQSQFSLRLRRWHWIPLRLRA
ncbi:hypothetical protein PHLCEN_2v9599 [Hermanssonia centrifuga]|uniref:Uncharacterized protein n=1 Tax=Hermanssonia centrifuga TaxID=98765 RepID=A0A2R6NR17_9APHY|nr:hypothetical protein PHLCEN_2v9599 [Hermanssonia centrifuga]